MINHLLCRHRHFLRLQLIEKLQKLFHNRLLQKAVNKINAGIPSCYGNSLADNIKITVQIQDFIQVRYIFIQMLGKPDSHPSSTS